ncbi:hypothetical protein [Flavobacterium sp.]|uniref:hypothetical protein n=1 Tax=Flavobacterium sp. TaxID=239 RepID=UPI00120873C2|nr:hypothetical protein [Flavobacterium sp.]RZJ69228.1 MAG: hypothetical protein EOO49_18190 [Flavobacterium sp.]
MKKLFFLIVPVLLLSFKAPSEAPKTAMKAKAAKEVVQGYKVCVRSCSATGIRTYLSPVPAGTTVYIHVNGVLVGTGTSYTVPTSASGITYSVMSGGFYAIIAGATVSQLQAVCGTVNPCV